MRRIYCVRHWLFLCMAAVLFFTGCERTSLPGSQSPDSPALSNIGTVPEELVVIAGASTPIELEGILGDGSKAVLTAENVALEANDPDLLWLEGLTLFASEDAGIGTQSRLTINTGKQTLDIPVTVKYSLEDTLSGQVSRENVPVVSNYDSTAVLVNKQRSLPENYKPDDLVIPDVRFSAANEERKHLRKPAADALEDLFAAAEKDGIILYAVSGYRSYNTQTTLFNNYAQQHGREEALRFSAPPGTSEHQTGLAMDVSSENMGFTLDQSFGDTAEGRWIAQHAAEFGFIIRYPQEYEDVTGYMYEPWHLRYVGEDIAKQVTEQKVTLEHYFGAVPVSAAK